MPGMPFIDWNHQAAALPKSTSVKPFGYAGHCAGFGSSVTAGFQPDTSSGREKGACDRAPEASADPSIFPCFAGLALSSQRGTSTSSSCRFSTGLSRYFSIYSIVNYQ
jgi:hypothetical protein